MKAWKPFALGLVVGAAVAGGSFTLVNKSSPTPTNRTAEDMEHAAYEAVALRAQNSLKTLTYIDAGELDSARQRSKKMLEFDATVLARYTPRKEAQADSFILTTKHEVADYLQESRGFGVP